MKQAKKRNARTEALSDEDTASRILAAATRLFASKGYDGTTTKEICEAAGAKNISAVHYHFKTKKDLYRRIVEQFATERLEAASSVLQPPLNAEELKVRIEILLRQIVDLLLKQPEVTLLVQRGMEMADLPSETIRNTLMNMFETLVKFLGQAKKKGLLAEEVDPFFAAGFLRAEFLYHTRHDEMMRKMYGRSLRDEKYRAEWIRQTVLIFMGGVLRK